MKTKTLDKNTLVHFLIGAGAGAMGVDPKMALLIALVAEGTFEAIRAQSHEVLFEAGHGQSKLNEIANLLAIVAGAHLGAEARKLQQERAATSPAPTPAPIVSSPDVAGMGYCAY